MEPNPMQTPPSDFRIIVEDETQTTGSVAEAVPFHAEIIGSTSASLTTEGLLSVEVAGFGEATLLGNFSSVQQQLTNPTTWESTDGSYTLTGADGDTLHGSYTGYGVPVPTGGLRIGAFWSIERGSGRFEGAFGGGMATGRHFADGSCFLVLEGLISLAGSFKPCSRESTSQS